jgi:hypothetical protein
MPTVKKPVTHWNIELQVNVRAKSAADAVTKASNVLGMLGEDLTNIVHRGVTASVAVSPWQRFSTVPKPSKDSSEAAKRIIGYDSNIKHAGTLLWSDVMAKWIDSDGNDPKCTHWMPQPV